MTSRNNRPHVACPMGMSRPRGISPMTPAGQRRPREAPSPVAHRHLRAGRAGGCTTGAGTDAGVLIGDAVLTAIPTVSPHRTVQWGRGQAPDGGG